MIKDHDQMFDLFAMPAWRAFVEEQRLNCEDLKANCYTLTSEQELFYHKGMIQVLSNIVNYQDIYRQMVDDEALPFESDV